MLTQRTGHAHRGGAIGQFASSLSDQWQEFVNDLVFDAFAASLQKAGYEVEMYSRECDHGDHERCAGKNRLREPTFQRCCCSCHKTTESLRVDDRKRRDDDTVS